eukprot:134226_1
MALFLISFSFVLNQISAVFQATEYECGFIQLHANSSLQPLNYCLFGNDYSYTYTCANDKPYQHYYKTLEICHESGIPDSIISINPVSYACSQKQCSFAEQTTYSKFTSKPQTVIHITNKCFNWLDHKNKNKSSIFYCYEDPATVVEVIFNAFDCINKFDLHLVNHTEECISNTKYNCEVKCFGQINNRRTLIEPIIQTIQSESFIINTALHSSNINYRSIMGNSFCSWNMLSSSDFNDTDLLERCHSLPDASQKDAFFTANGTEILTINNLIFDSYIFSGKSTQPYYIVFAEGTFICNNCTFSNIIIQSNHYSTLHYPSAIVASDIQFNNCTFVNISYVKFRLTNEGKVNNKYGYSFVRVISNNHNTVIPNVMIDHSSVNNINMLHSFVYCTAESLDITTLSVNASEKIYIVIQDVTFDNISMANAIFYHEPWWSGKSNFSIVNTNFFDINQGAILYADPYGAIGNEYHITNVIITTSQTKEEFNSDVHASLFTFQTTSDVIHMNNINVKYDYAEKLNNHCQTYMTEQYWEAIEAER